MGMSTPHSALSRVTLKNNTLRVVKRLRIPVDVSGSECCEFGQV